MTPEFSAADDSTWPLVLTIDQIAAIYQRTVGAIRKALETQRFIPTPFEKRPYRWRKADVIRHVVGQRAIGRTA